MNPISFLKAAFAKIARLKALNVAVAEKERRISALQIRIQVLQFSNIPPRVKLMRSRFLRADLSALQTEIDSIEKELDGIIGVMPVGKPHSDGGTAEADEGEEATG